MKYNKIIINASFNIFHVEGFHCFLNTMKITFNILF